MKASYIKTAILDCMKANLPVFLWGAPGVGKSHVVAQVAEEIDYLLYDVRATQIDQVDLRGVPTIVTVNGTPRTIWALPNLLPTAADIKGHRGAIVFFDEINAALPSMQATFYQIIGDRKCGDYVAPPNVYFLAAGNREGDRAVVNRMPSPLANRFVHFDFDVDHEELIAYATKKSWSPFIIAFLRFRPALVHTFDKNAAQVQFASPRTYEYASRLLAAGLSPSVEYESLKGCLGEAVANEFAGFLKICRHLPDPEKIIKSPTTAPIPPEKETATLYALVGVLARKANEKNIDNIFTYLKRMPKEYQVLFVRDIKKLSPSLCDSVVYVAWKADNKEVEI